jgi:hypothetical protein
MGFGDLGLTKSGAVRYCPGKDGPGPEGRLDYGGRTGIRIVLRAWF